MGPTPAIGGFVISCLLVYGLAGCSKELTPSSPVTPPPTTSSTNTASTSANPPGPSTTTPTPTGPYDPIPEGARQHTNDGALAFTTFWVEQVDHAYQAPNPGAISRLCTPEAQLCQTIEEINQNLARTGQRSPSSLLRVERASLRASNVPDATQILVTMHQTPYRIIDAAGGVVEEYHDEYTQAFFTLTWSGNGWIISGMNGVKH